MGTAVILAPAVEQLILLGIQIYKQIEAARDPTTPVRPLADILASADAQFTQIQADSKL